MTGAPPMPPPFDLVAGIRRVASAFTIAWVEGVEVNFLGLVAGLDLRHPAVKLPAFGRIGFDGAVAAAAPAK